jgi:mono/diheme cytochrome c family protein
MRKKIVIIVMAAVTFMPGCGDDIPKARLENGKKVYDTYCQSCHMQDGGGVPNMNAPLAKSEYVAGETEKLVSIVLKGSAAFADDPGRSYKNVMASMAQLTDTEIADVLTYVRNNFGNKGAAISPEEVKATREKMN